MILGLFILIYMFLNILFFVKNHKKIAEFKVNADNDYLKLRNNLPNFKKKNALALLVSAVITIMIYTLPVSLIVILYLQIPVMMIFGQFNLILTYVGLMSIMIIFDIIRIKILNSYVIEVQNEGIEVDKFNLKENIICNILNPLNSGLYAALVIAMMILLK